MTDLDRLGTYTLLHIDGPRAGEVHDVPADLVNHGSYYVAHEGPVALNDYLDGAVRPSATVLGQTAYHLHLMRLAGDLDLLYLRVAHTSRCSPAERSIAMAALRMAVVLIVATRGTVGLDEGRAWWVEFHEDPDA